MLNAKKTLTKVLKVFDDMVLYDDQTSESKSVSANSTQVYSIDFSKQGYKVLGVKRINFNNTSCVNAGFSFDTTDTLTVVLRNTTNAAANAYIRVEVAYIKSELIGGGYFLKVFSIFSRLAERWWGYAECKEDADKISRTICDRHIHGRFNNGNIGNAWNLFCSANSRHLKDGIYAYWNHKCGTKAFVLQSITHNILVNTACHLLESANERIFRSCERCGYNGTLRKGVTISERGWSCA